MSIFKKQKSKSFKFFIQKFLSFNNLKRMGTYYWFRLNRLPGSTYSISAGFACGSMVSFTPLLGLHFLLAILFAYFLRANLFAALIGTAIGNPITFPLIWGLIYNIGAFIISKPDTNIINEINVNLILNQTYEVLLPMLIGASVMAVPIWIISYSIMYSFVSSYKKAKKRKNNNT
jgi:hypothetical protein